MPSQEAKAGSRSNLARVGLTPLSVCWVPPYRWSPDHCKSSSAAVQPSSTLVHMILATFSPNEHKHCKHISEGTFNDISQKDLYAISQGASQMVQWLVTHLPVQDARDRSLIPGSGRSPGVGNGIPLQYSCQNYSTDRGAWWATVRGVTKSQTLLSDWACTPYHRLLIMTYLRKMFMPCR